MKFLFGVAVAVFVVVVWGIDAVQNHGVWYLVVRVLIGVAALAALAAWGALMADSGVRTQPYSRRRRHQ